jgi:predicted ester cyclase
MGFTLKHLRTAEVKNFSTKELLEILGDKINDEILVNGEVYRISSFVATDGGDFTPPTFEWQIAALTATNGATTFPFNATAETIGLFLTINGILYEYGQNKDFHVANGNLIWHGKFSIQTNDTILVKWLKIA